MKSKSSKFLLGALVLAIIIAGVYFFVIRKDTGVVVESGLVSTNNGTPQGLQNTTATGDTTGSQVVSILRNLSVIKLDDSVFKNPAFALLTDVSISLPPITNQGRRNPFAAVGTDAVAPATTTTTTNTTTGGPSF